MASNPHTNFTKFTNLHNYGQFKTEFKALTGKKMKTVSLADRIVIQKIAYLLHKKGIYCANYGDFSWYLHGVFCYDLWADTLKLEEPSVREKAVEQGVLKEIRDFKDKLKKAGLTRYLTDSGKLELMTTILYIAKKQENLNGNDDSFVERVKGLKDKFTEYEIRKIIGKLREINWEFN